MVPGGAPAGFLDIASLDIASLDARRGSRAEEARRPARQDGHVRAERRAHAGVLHLDQHLPAVLQTGPVLLGDGGGGQSLFLEAREDRVDGLAEAPSVVLDLGPDDLQGLVPGLLAALAQRGPYSRREHGALDAQHLADLHLRASRRAIPLG